MESIVGIVQRVTYHNEETGWSVLRVNPASNPSEVMTVTVHQSQVFAGATLEFKGEWITHKKFGEQFKALDIVERKPASAAALEKYLGSGLIFGVGPATAKKIVRHFGSDTLDIFEDKIERLVEVPGISARKLENIRDSWAEHREIRDIMMFLQQYGISTLFAVKIYKYYEGKSIEVVSQNPYQLSKDIYGIGFFSADKVALNMGFERDSPERIGAGIKHILSSSREFGHCYLTLEQIVQQTGELLQLTSEEDEKIITSLEKAEEEKELCTRTIEEDEVTFKYYYNKSLYYDEKYVAEWVSDKSIGQLPLDLIGARKWLDDFNGKQKFPLSDEQYDSVFQIAQQPFSILTGGPGCGKTTTTNTLVKLILALDKQVILAAPTGRAAQRMGEVIGREAKTIHRLLVWEPGTGRFKKNEEDPLDADFIIVDECSMLDISLTASLLKAIRPKTQVLFIGDVDQLPSVGAGNVLKDLIESQKVPCYALTKVFRQAQESFIISNAHKINKGETPKIESPIHDTNVWDRGVDCLFVDSEEASKEQKDFIKKVSKVMKETLASKEKVFIKKNNKETVSYEEIQQKDNENYFSDAVAEEEVEYARQNLQKSYIFNIPQKFLHADIHGLLKIDTEAEALKNLMKKVHPWSSLHYGFTASEMVIRLYTQSIPSKLGKDREIQILSPMTRGTLGTKNLNLLIQQTANAPSPEKPEIKVGERIFRLGDRVIQKRNNYDLSVFNGDIGYIIEVDSENNLLEVEFKTADEERSVVYQKDQLIELDLAYAITIHKSQGSEFDVVIMPIVTQHFNMLYRNLIYTGLTRAKKMAMFVGTRKALTMAVKNIDNRQRQTYLKELIE